MNFKVYVSSKDSDQRVAPISMGEIVVGDTEAKGRITIDPTVSRQKWIGFGGALTEASAYALSHLEEEEQQKVLQSYFDEEEGIGYNMARLHIHSCDFALGNYTYVEEGDSTLETFTLDRDERFVLPLVRRVQDLVGKELLFLASPWSPPAFMKTNGEMNHGGKLKEEYQGLWAEYYAKYILAMREKDMEIWAITVQNEPDAVQVWDSCVYSAEEERDFVKNHLGPTLERYGLGDIKIIIWDHNRDIVYPRAKTVLEDKEAAKYVWGTGIHWYVSEEFENTSKVHDEFPDKHLIFTEGCQEGGVRIGEWFTGERYGRNIIGDINNYIEGWMDWNIILDETGGPNHVNNLCDAPIIVDKVKQVVHYNSSYYYIAHFSKFLKRGATILNTSVTGDKLHSISWKSEEGKLGFVVMNEGEVDMAVEIEIGQQKVETLVKSHSIYTWIEE